MSVVENIMSGTILLLVLVSIGIIITTQSVETTQERLDFRQTSYLEDKHQGGLNTIMLLTEPETRQSYGRLIARAVYEDRNTITLPSGGEVNISELVDDALVAVYGEGNYYAQVRPYISDVHIRIIFDGTSSLDYERQIVRENIESIIDTTRSGVTAQFGEANAPDITFRVYIVSNDVTLCEPFKTTSITTEGYAGCTTVDKDRAYGAEGLMDEPTVNVPALNDRYGADGNEVYFEADWAVGVAESIENLTIGEDAIREESSLVILFPITDELTTGSIPDTCYSNGTPLVEDLGSDDQSNNLEKRIVSRYSVYCALCEETCPTARSQAQIDQLNEYIESSGIADVLTISSVFSEDCEASYDTGLNDVPGLYWQNSDYLNAHIDGHVTDPDSYDPGTGNTYCDFNRCGGCSTNDASDRASPQICFRSECSIETQKQLSALSDRYGGSPIDLTDVGTLPEKIIDEVNDVTAEKVLEFGERREQDTRYVSSYNVLLPNNERVPFTVWIYEDREFSDTVPTVNISAAPEAVPPGQSITINTRIRSDASIVNVRVRPTNEDTWIEPDLTYLAGTFRSYNATYDTSGLPDGWYDVEYEVYDSNFNTYRDTIEDVFKINTSLKAKPLPSLDLVAATVLPQNSETVATMTITNTNAEPEPSAASQVYLLITDPNGDTRRIEMQLVGETWTTTFNGGDLEGFHTAGVEITDALGRTETHDGLDSYEVKVLISCSSKSDCSGHNCVGDIPGEFYCRQDPGADGEYTPSVESCNDGLAHDAIEEQCYDPDTTYDIVILPLRGYDTFEAFEPVAMRARDALYESTPMQECGNAQEVFRIHLGTDLECGANNGCTSTSSVDSCIDAARLCAEREFPGLSVKHYGLSTTRWGGTRGKAGSFGSPTMVAAEDALPVVFLHEAGHTWHLGHLRCNVPYSDIPRYNAGPCYTQYPNYDDCDTTEQLACDDIEATQYSSEQLPFEICPSQQPTAIHYMDYCMLDPAREQYGPAGYDTIKQQLQHYLDTCETP